MAYGADQHLFDKLVQHYLTLKPDLTEMEAKMHVNMCLKTTTAMLKVQGGVSTTLHVITEMMERGPQVECSSITTPEACAEDANCAWYQAPTSKAGACRDRLIPDAELINSDPDVYATGLSTKALTDLVELAAFLYYNYDGGGLTDNSFDALQYHLNKRLKLKGRMYEKIGAPPLERMRVALPGFVMGSLPKYYPVDIPKFLATRPKLTALRWSHKLDGVSAAIVYEGSIPKGVYTRGDGTIGGNVSFLLTALDGNPITGILPRITEKARIVIRGELILTKDRWEHADAAKTYTNARAAVSGAVNSGVLIPLVKEIGFVAYDILLGPGADTDAFGQLKKYGFTTPTHGMLDIPTLPNVMMIYQAERATSPYFIDGLVLRFGTEPRVAFKMQLEEQSRKSKVISVEWNISRYGRYVPVAVFEAVFIDGSRLHRASAFNAGKVREWSMGKGTIVTVARAGDVIPQLRNVEPNPAIRAIYPKTEAEGGYAWHWERNDIVLDDIEGNRDVQIARILHFYSSIGTPRLGEKTIEKLWDYGFNTVAKVAAVKPAELIKLPRIGKVLSTKIYENIHKTLRSTRLERFFNATTLDFKMGIGEKLSRTLFSKYPDVIEDTEDGIRDYLAKNKLPNFGPKRNESVAIGMPKFRDFLYSLGQADIKAAIQAYKDKREKLEREGKNPLIEGKNFVLTGFMGRTDYELEDLIYDNGGDIVSSLPTPAEGKKKAKGTEVTAVIVGGLGISSTMLEARTMGIPVYTVNEFFTNFGAPELVRGGYEAEEEE